MNEINVNTPSGLTEDQMLDNAFDHSFNGLALYCYEHFKGANQDERSRREFNRQLHAKIDHLYTYLIGRGRRGQDPHIAALGTATLKQIKEDRGIDLFKLELKKDIDPLIPEFERQKELDLFNFEDLSDLSLEEKTKIDFSCLGTENPSASLEEKIERVVERILGVVFFATKTRLDQFSLKKVYGEDDSQAKFIKSVATWSSLAFEMLRYEMPKDKKVLKYSNHLQELSFLHDKKKGDLTQHSKLVFSDLESAPTFIEMGS
jgi:hypothetical protein